MNDCPDGRLTRVKFSEMYTQFFPKGDSNNFCEHVFRTFDKDGSGDIDFKEFIMAMDVTEAGSPEGKLKWAFKMYDVKGNGVIDKHEMTEIVQAIFDMCIGQNASCSAEERAINIFQRMDVNGDGTLTEDEFLKGCMQDLELQKMLLPANH